MADASEILVIEDQASIRGNIERLLRLEGFAVLSTTGGVKGLQLARTYRPSLILCDIVMPHLDGYGVLDGLRSELLTASISVAFLTGSADRAEREEGLRRGAAAYLIKPFDLKALLQLINRLRLEN